MPPRTSIPIQESRMRSNSIVPYYHSSRRPLNACLEILALGNVIIQEVQKKFALFLLVAYDATTELRIYKERLLAGRWMCAHEWVDGGYWVAADDASTVLAVVGLLDCGVNNLQSMETLPELW